MRNSFMSHFYQLSKGDTDDYANEGGLGGGLNFYVVLTIILCGTNFPGFLLGIFQGGQNLLLCKFLLLCFCFRTKFQGGAKVFRGGAPLWKKASFLFGKV